MRCLVKDCENYQHQGKFVGELCAPCYQFLVTGQGVYSQLYRNTVLRERAACEILQYDLVHQYTGLYTLLEYQAFKQAVELYAQEIKQRSQP